MYKKYQLKNGMKVLLVESHKSPVLSIQMWVKTGSADEKKGEEGISHFIEHLVFKGSHRFKVGEIAAAVEGAGGELNAYTSFDQTVFYVTISREFQRVGMEVIAEMMGFPTFDENEINNEREVVIEEIKRSNDSPHRQASRLLFSTVYKKHPYGIPVIGYPENISTVSRETLLSYFSGRYNPKNMTLVIAGDFENSEMRRQVDEFFGPFKPNKLRVVKRPKVKKAKANAVVIEKAPFNETIVHIAFPIPDAAHKDIPGLEVFALVFGQGESSRLNQRLRMRDHIVNYAGSSVFVSRDPGFLAISLSLNEKDLKLALAALQDELLKALCEPPSDQEINKALTNLASEQFYAQETVDGLARNFGHYQDLFNDPGHFSVFLKQVEKLSGREVIKKARKHIENNGLSFILMSPADKERVEPLVKEWVKSFRAKLKKSRIKTPKPTRKAKKISFVMKSPRDARSSVEKWTLGNGVTVITRPSYDTPVISLRCASLGGSRLETKESQGATELLSRVWTAGAGEFSESQIHHRTDEMAASLSAFGGRNSEGLTMTCLRPFLDEMLHLFFLTLKEPLFESAAIARETKAMQEQVKLRADNPSQLCILEFMKAMFGSHPYGRDPYGDPGSIERLNQTVVRHIYRQKTGLTIVASGAFDPKEMRKKIEQELAGLNPGPLEVRKFPLQYPKKETRRFIESQKEQSHIVMGFPGLDLKDPNRYSMQVMQAILAGQGGRLFYELRDKASLAYSVAPLRMEGIEGGYFGAYIGCSPEKAAKAIEMMNTEFQKLVESKVGEEELARAQRYLIGKHDIELQRNSNISSAILFDHIYGLDYMDTFHFAERVRSVTSESVRGLAAHIFSTAPVISLVGPTAPW